MRTCDCRCDRSDVLRVGEDEARGRIVERGTHTELLARRGAYWEMVRA